MKSGPEIPLNFYKFINLFLLFSIGFKGGQEISHSQFETEILWSLLFGVFRAPLVLINSFFINRKKLGLFNAGEIAASYGSVSAVTFVTAIFLGRLLNMDHGGMVAVMARMEAVLLLLAQF